MDRYKFVFYVRGQMAIGICVSVIAELKKKYLDIILDQVKAPNVENVLIAIKKINQIQKSQCKAALQPRESKLSGLSFEGGYFFFLGISIFL